MPMLMLAMVMLLLAQLPPLLQSAQAFPSRPVTRFPFPPQERLPRLSARRLLISRSSRIVPKLSAPPVLSNLSSSLTRLLLLELTPGLDLLLLLPLMVPLLLLPQLLLLPMVVMVLLLSVPVLLLVLLPQLLLDMLVLELDLLDMLDGNQKCHLHFCKSQTVQSLLCHYFLNRKYSFW